MTLVFGFSWALWLGSGVLRQDQWAPVYDMSWFWAQMGVFGPSLWALVFVAVLHREKRRQSLALLAGFVPVILLMRLIAARAGGGVLDLSTPLQAGVLVLASAVIATAALVRRPLETGTPATKQVPGTAVGE